MRGVVGEGGEAADLDGAGAQDSGDAAFLCEIEGALRAQERGDWHCVLGGLCRAVQIWAGAAPTERLYECRVSGVRNGWQAVVRVPCLMAEARCEVQQSMRAARISARRVAAVAFPSTLERACVARVQHATNAA